MSRKHKIEFQLNYAKAVEAVLYVLSKQKSVNMYNVLKVIFEADKRHLNAHGRPVTGDTYIKMEYGTVPSAIYDMFKDDPSFLAALNLETYPFVRQNFHLSATRNPNLDYLSKSDIDSLDQGIDAYPLNMPFGEVKDKNHLERCWIESEMKSRIDFVLMIENQEVRKMLEGNPLRLVV